MEPVKVRKTKRSDVKDVMDLIIRLKKLNNEFDPLSGVVATPASAPALTPAKNEPKRVPV